MVDRRIYNVPTSGEIAAIVLGAAEESRPDHDYRLRRQDVTTFPTRLLRFRLSLCQTARRLLRPLPCFRSPGRCLPTCLILCSHSAGGRLVFIGNSDAMCMPAHFVLLFSRSDAGWTPGLRRVRPLAGGRAAAPDDPWTSLLLLTAPSL